MVTLDHAAVEKVLRILDDRERWLLGRWRQAKAEERRTGNSGDAGYYDGELEDVRELKMVIVVAQMRVGVQ